MSLNHWSLLTAVAVMATVFISSDGAPSYADFLGSQDDVIENDNRHSYDGDSKKQQGRLIGAEYYPTNLWKPKARSVPLSAFDGKSSDLESNVWSQGYGNLDAHSQADGSWDSEYPKDKREGHSLSIVNPLDVLRQRLLLENARRRMKENQEQIRANEVLLKTLGKRDAGSHYFVGDDEGNSEFAKAERRRAKREQRSDREETSAKSFEV